MARLQESCRKGPVMFVGSLFGMMIPVNQHVPHLWPKTAIKGFVMNCDDM